MAINISFVSDASQVIRDADNIGDSLRGVADELETTGNKGKDLGDKLEAGLSGVEDELDRAGRSAKDLGDDLERGLKDGGKAAESLEDDIRSAMRKAADAADDAGKKIGNETKRGFDKASDGADEFKDEANSTAREAAASFDGSADSIMDAFQEVAANAFAGFGPAGALAGLAIAAGLGLAMKAINDLAEENDEAAQSVVDLANQYVEAGGEISGVDLASNIRDFYNELREDNPITPWKNEAVTNFEYFSDKLKDTGVDVTKVMNGMSGDMDQNAEASQILESKISELDKVIADGTITTGRFAGTLDVSGREAQKQKNNLEEAKKAVDGHREESERGEKQAEGLTKAIEGTTEALLENIEALEAQAGIHQTSLEANDAWEQSIDDATATIKENGKTLDNNTAKGRDNRTALYDMAEAARDKARADAEAGESSDSLARDMQVARDKFMDTARAAGASAEEARNLADDLGLIPHEVDTDVTADTKDARRKINEVDEMRPWVDARVDADTSEARNDIDRLDGRNVTVDAGARTGRARDSIDSMDGRSVYVNVDANTNAAWGAINRMDGSWITIQADIKAYGQYRV